MAVTFDLATFGPVVESLRAGAPAGTRHTVMVGTVTSWEASATVTDDAEYRDELVPRTDNAVELLRDLVEGAPDTGVFGFDLALNHFPAPGGHSAELMLIPFDDVVHPGVSDVIGDVLLDPAAVPAPYRIPARPVETTACATDADGVRASVRRLSPNAVPTPAEALDAFESATGLPLPPELRALYETMTEGDLTLTGEATFGATRLTILPLGGAEARERIGARSRFLEWQFGATEVVHPDPMRRVQPVAVSDQWIPFATDTSDDVYCVDLAPDSNGTVGQVVVCHHEEISGALPVAESLAAFLRGSHFVLDEQYQAGRANPSRRVHLPSSAGRRRANGPIVIDDDVEVLVASSTEHDLRPLAEHPSLRTLELGQGALTDVDVLTRLPALEYLCLSREDWRRVIDAGAVPRGLLAFRVAAGRVDRPREVVDIVNHVLALYGRPPVATTLFTQ